MATKMIRQTIFTTGEVDAITFKRTDVQEYLTAAQSLKNCIVGTTGLVRKRYGSEKAYDATGRAMFNSRIFEFIDNNGNYYILLMSHGKCYVIQVPNNAAQVVTGDATVVDYVPKQVVAYANETRLVATIVTPYLASEIDDLDYTQDGDSIIFAHPSHPTARIYVSAYDPLVFTFESLNIFPLPSYDFGDINYNDLTVQLSVVGDVLTFKFTGVTTDHGFTNAWIGGQIVGGGNSEFDPIGYAIITAFSFTGTEIIFTATVQIPFKTTDYATKGSQYQIKQPIWTFALGFPSKVYFYQSRLWLGNTKALPTMICGSKINAPINYDVGTGKDTDAIIYNIGQNNSGAIRWINGGKQLEIFCNFEFACPQDSNSALTPSTFAVRQQSSFGASPLLKPTTYINDTYYVNQTGKSIINYRFNGVGLTYISSNISAASQHLVRNPRNRALIRGSASNQDNFVYFLNDDDTLTCFQFAQEAKLAALTPVEFQEDVDVIDIATINNRLFILKYYVKTGKYTIERTLDGPTDIRIDNAQTASMASSGLITGLEALAGYTVQVVYENQDYGEYVVNDAGEITVNNPEEIADTVTVGLLYDVDAETMFLFAGQTASPFFKQITRIYVDYYQSLDFYVNDKLVNYQEFADIQQGLPLAPRDGTAIIEPYDGWERFATISITQRSPFDLQILSIGYQIAAAYI